MAAYNYCSVILLQATFTAFTFVFNVEVWFISSFNTFVVLLGVNNKFLNLSVL